ncbi:LLM class flavin-dependent oxidoreductase [Dactylosporangium sp. NPDC005555]|uniref:LLM class flavin-dependent oxidoreductase n=1 Tax=Dactylosporangium sp. NPDC005555 TaxID=3154889 RepID=UPI0033AB1753
MTGYPIRAGLGLGLFPMWDDGAEFATIVTHAERSGFDSLWLSEHLTGPTPAPLPQLAYAAALTTRMRLGTSVTVLAGRSPVDLAKSLATVDRLSGGRLLPIFGLGIAEPAEHQAFGIGRTARAQWVEEALPLLRRMLRGERVTHASALFELDDIGIGMSAARREPDLWLGGRTDPELRRAGRLADGWLGSFAAPAAVGRAIGIVHQAAEAAGRAVDGDHFGVLLLYSDTRRRPREAADLLARRYPDEDPHWLCPAGPDALGEVLAAHADQGASKFIVVPAARPRSWPDEIDALRAALAGPLRDIRARPRQHG